MFLHGDDFASVGHRAALKWFLQKLESRFEIKTSVIGTGVGEVREARVLNRILRITELGWEYEPDQRHAEMIVEQLGLKDAKPVETPTEEEKKWEKEEDEKELDPDKQRHFRSIAARCNYIAADRPDLMFAVKCICREMAKPSVGAWKKLKRVGRYLVGKSRSILKYDWQGRETLVDGYTDSDWAGCVRTAKSTSGGILMIGGHMIKAWSKTQNSISLSSAEAELIAMVKLSTELIGLMSLARDLNCRLHGRVWADSSAALAIVKRSGAGKLRHINISLLWVQEQEKLKKLVYEKVPGQANPADLFTKGVGREKLQQFAWASGQAFLEGRAQTSLQVQGGSKTPISAHAELLKTGARGSYSDALMKGSRRSVGPRTIEDGRWRPDTRVITHVTIV